MTVLDRIVGWFSSEPLDLEPVPLRRRVRELEIITARLVRSGFEGEYRAAFQGRGIEFSQVREYQPGDDIRTIDWNVTARTGVPHVKQFVEERDLTVVVAVDVSGSMAFGSLDRRKIDIALELASVLSFAALQNRDRVGLLLFASDVIRYLPPRRGRVHVETMVQIALEQSRACGGRTHFDPVARFLEKTHRRRAVILVLSDFLDSDPLPPLKRLARRHDVVAIEIVDPREESLPEAGLVPLVDSETGARILLDLAAAKRGAAVKRQGIAESFRRAAIDHLPVSTAVPYDEALMAFFRKREARRR